MSTSGDRWPDRAPDPAWPPPPPPPPPRPSARRPAAWSDFAAWAAMGMVYALGFISILSIGIFILPCAVVGTILMARRGGGPGAVGLLSGLSLPLFYVAWLNRGGPGMVCTTLSGGGTNCTDEYNPWIWFVIGVVLLVTGAGIFGGRLRAKRVPPGVT